MGQNIQGRFHWISTPDNSIEFTADNTVTDKPLSLTGGAAIFEDASGKNNFIFGENIIIERLYVQFPYQFGIGALDTIEPKLTLGWTENPAGASGTVNEFGNAGEDYFLDPATQYNIPIYFDAPSDLIKWQLRIDAITGNVSQINSPAALNGLVLNIRVYLLIRHTFNML